MTYQRGGLPGHAESGEPALSIAVMQFCLLSGNRKYRGSDAAAVFRHLYIDIVDQPVFKKAGPSSK
jgi:hypothetical protein